MLVFAAVTAIAIVGASQLRIDRSQVENFAPGEPIRIADEVLNQRFSGTAFLDIIVETTTPEGLLTLDAMQKLHSLQSYFESLPHVRKTVSIVDVVSHLHGALEGLPADRLAERPLPNTDTLVSEALLLYEITGDPADLEEEIDPSYQHALIRGALNAQYFSEHRVVVESLERYIADEFNTPDLRATLAGDVNVGYHWIGSLGASHFKGVVLSLTLVLAASIIVFRSPTAGLISVVPVVFTVLLLYACMGFLGIYLEPATSMFAAIALGVGVDFAIHLVDRLRAATEEFGGDLGRALDLALPPVARACFFNSAALGIGFSVLLVSDLPTLTRFGGLVALASFASYLTALMIVPALFAAERAWFGGSVQMQGRASVPISLLVIAAVLVSLFSGSVLGAEPDGDDVAAAVAERPESQAARRVIEMTLTNRRGKVQERVALVHKQNNDDIRMTRVTFLQPARFDGMTFLSHDSRGASSGDGRWMYLPASRRVRSIPASRRGDAFFGTDFSYEDIQSEFKFKLDEWVFTYDGRSLD